MEEYDFDDVEAIDFSFDSDALCRWMSSDGKWHEGPLPLLKEEGKNVALDTRGEK